MSKNLKIAKPQTIFTQSYVKSVSAVGLYEVETGNGNGSAVCVEW